MQEYGIEVVPLSFYAGGKLYHDGVDVTPSQAYELFLEDPDSFKTSAASPQDFIQAFRRAAERGSDVLCIMVSSGISGTCNIARTAVKLVGPELKETRIEVIDSHTAAAAEGMIALAAARAIDGGLELEGAIDVVTRLRERVHTAVLLDTLKHVYRSGRIPRAASKIGSALSIRPIFTIHDTVRFAGMVRSARQGIERILGMMRKETGQNRINVAVMHVYAASEAENLRRRIENEFDCNEIWLTEFSPIMGYACGTGALGISYYLAE